MKKLALVLGTLLLAATASAKEVVAAPVEVQEVVVEEAVVAAPVAPIFRVTSIGQELEYETRNTDASNYPTLYNTVNLGYGDNWTFQMQGVKGWEVADADHGSAEQDSSAQTRLAAKRTFKFDNGAEYGARLRWRGYDDHNNYYLDQNYGYEAVSGWVTVAYKEYENGATGLSYDTGSGGSQPLPKKYDYVYSEAEPVKIAIGPMTLSYYYEYEAAEGNDAYSLEHQARVYFPIHEGEKFSLTGEYRLGLSKETEGKNGETLYGIGSDYDFGQKNVLYFYPSYAVNENLTVGGYLGLEMGTWNTGDNGNDERDSYYCDYGLTWEYKF